MGGMPNSVQVYLKRYIPYVKEKKEKKWKKRRKGGREKREKVKFVKSRWWVLRGSLLFCILYICLKQLIIKI